MEYPREITVIQATVILISSVVGVGVLGMPRLVVETAGTAAPLVTVCGVLLAAFGIVMMVLVGLRFPRKNIIRYSEEILGKWLARFISLFIILFFITSTALTVRGFGEVVKTSILTETPLEITVIVMLFLAAMSTRQDVNTLAYIHLFYLPFLFLPGVFIFSFALEDVDPIFLLPLWDNEPGKMASGTSVVAALFQGAFIITLLIPSMRRPERAMTASLWGIGIGGVLHLIVVMMTLAFFGPEEIKELVWPTLELAKATRFPVLERLDAAFLAGWLMVVFTTSYATYYISVHAMSELFRLRDHRFLAPFLFPFIYLVAIMPPNVKQYYTILQSVGMIGLCLTIVYPLVLWMVAVIRGKGERQHGKKRMGGGGSPPQGT